MSVKSNIVVRRGEVYRVPRRGKISAYIKVTGIRQGPQPKVTYRRVTKSGKNRNSKETAIRWLQFADRSWRFPPAWERVEPPCRTRPVKKTRKKTRRKA